MATHASRREAVTGWVAEPEAPTAPATGPSETTVLVVDDDPDALEIAREFLLRADFRVLTADGGARALEVFRAWSEKIDVVVLDLSMPEMDGDATFDEIRKVRKDARVVIVSGFPETLAARQFSATGAADGFLAKPYLPEALIRCVRAALAEGPTERAPHGALA